MTLETISCFCISLKTEKFISRLIDYLVVIRLCNHPEVCMVRPRCLQVMDPMTLTCIIVSLNGSILVSMRKTPSLSFTRNLQNTSVSLIRAEYLCLY